MTAGRTRMQNSGRGDRPATDMIVESTAHDLDLRKFRHG